MDVLVGLIYSNCWGQETEQCGISNCVKHGLLNAKLLIWKSTIEYVGTKKDAKPTALPEATFVYNHKIELHMSELLWHLSLSQILVGMYN